MIVRVCSAAATSEAAKARRTDEHNHSKMILVLFVMILIVSRNLDSHSEILTRPCHAKRRCSPPNPINPGTLSRQAGNLQPLQPNLLELPNILHPFRCAQHFFEKFSTLGSPYNPAYTSQHRNRDLFFPFSVVEIPLAPSFHLIPTTDGLSGGT